jgi:hypothetical protein
MAKYISVFVWQHSRNAIALYVHLVRTNTSHFELLTDNPDYDYLIVNYMAEKPAVAPQTLTTATQGPWRFALSNAPTMNIGQDYLRTLPGATIVPPNSTLNQAEYANISGPGTDSNLRKPGYVVPPLIDSGYESVPHGEMEADPAAFSREPFSSSINNAAVITWDDLGKFNVEDQTITGNVLLNATIGSWAEEQ